MVVGGAGSAPAPPGCSLGRWSAAPSAALAASCPASKPLLEHAASLLPAPTAAGLWSALGLAVSPAGLAWQLPAALPRHSGCPSGEQLLQAARLLLASGHEECGRHILREWVAALSFPKAWLHCRPPVGGQLAALWRQHMDPAAALAWWQERLGCAPGGGGGEGQRSQPRHRLHALCGTEFVELVGQLMGPVAGEHASRCCLLKRWAGRC